MSQYQLVWDDTRTGRLRNNDDHSPTLAWLRLTWVANGTYNHTIDHVDIYTHHTHVPERLWVAAAPTIEDAVAHCDTHLEQLQAAITSPGLPAELGGTPWEHHHIVTTG